MTISIFLFSFSILLLWILNFSKKKRYRQILYPKAALLFSCIAMWLYIKPIDGIQQYINQFIEILAEYFYSYTNYYSFQQQFPLYYNLGILIIFATIKLTLGVLYKISDFWSLFQREKDKQDDIEQVEYINFPYKSGEEGIYLEYKWITTAQYMVSMSFFSFIILIFCIYEAYVYSLNQVIHIPKLPAIPMLLFFEISWYLGGYTSANLKEQEKKNRDKKQKRDKDFQIEVWKELWKVYKELHEHARILSMHEPNKKEDQKKLNFPTKESLSANKNIELRTLINHLNNKYIIDIHGFQMLESLWKHDDILISESTFEKSAPLVFALLQKNIADRNKIIILTHDNNRIEGWINNWMNKDLFASYKPKIVKNRIFHRDEDIIISSVQDLLNYPMESAKDWFGQASVVISINISDVIFPNIGDASTLFRILKDMTEQEEMQFILWTTEKRKNMLASLYDYLSIRPKEFHFSSKPLNEQCYMVWPTEDESLLQNLILKNYPYRINSGIVLSVPALKKNIKSIRMIGAEKEPWRDYIEKIDMWLTQSWKTHEIKTTPGNAINYNKVPYICSSLERDFIIAHDTDYNLVTTLYKAMAFGRNESFVHVVTSQYLLRDYFADNLDFFLERCPETISLAPTLLRESSTVAYYLIKRLLFTELDEDEILSHLNRIEYHSQDVLHEEIVFDRLIDLFKRVFNIDYSNRLILRIEDSFNKGQLQFEKKLKYKIKHEVDKDIHDEVYNIKDYANHVLKTIPKDHIYQNYLPGQLHSFDGQLFKIVAIDDRTNSIKAERIESEKTISYKHINDIVFYSIAPFRETIQEETFKTHEISKRIFEVHYKITTTGYFSFMNGYNFLSDFGYIDLKNNNITRQYKQGRMLGINIVSNDNNDIGNNALNISLTLALIFKELFVTIFPESYQYLQTTTTFEASHQEDDFSDDVLKLIPRIEFDLNNPYEKNSIILFIIEDSKKDMGLVKAIYDNLDFLFQLIEDYLSWYLDKSDAENRFLTYGTDKLPKWMNLEATRELMRSLVDHNQSTIGKERNSKSLKKDKQVMETSSKNILGTCAFCKKPFTSPYFMRFEDGRYKCKDCRDKSVDTIEEITQMYKEAKEWMITKYKLQFQDNFFVKFADTEEIKTDTGLIGETKYNEDEDKYTISIISSKEYVVSIATMIYKITRIWQLCNLNCDKVNQKDKQLLKGHAKWTTLNFLEDKDIGELLQVDIKTDPAFKSIDKYLKDSGKSNLFELLKKEYGTDDENLDTPLSSDNEKTKGMFQKIRSIIKRIFRFKKETT